MYSTRYFCRILMTFEFSRQIFEKKNSNIKFHQNPSNGSLDVSYGQTERDTDMTKLIVAFRSFCERA